MAISFVAASTAFSRIGSGSGFTLNKPAGYADGAILIASVCFDSGGSLRTVTPPSGWTFLTSARGADDGRDNQISVLYRVGAAGDPSTWTGSLSSSSTTLLTTAVVAYSGVQAVGLSGTSATGLDTSFATATVNNSTTNSWRIVIGSYSSATTSYTITSNETTRRILFAADDSGSTGACQSAHWDSNAGIATGNTSRTVSRSASWSTASSVLVLLTPTTGTPATGTWESTLGKVTAAADGDVVDNAALAMSLPSVSASAAGFGAPPDVTSVLASTTPSVSASVSAATDAMGTLDTIVPIGVSVVGETRSFGIRVLNVEADDRTIVVESRGVAD